MARWGLKCWFQRRHTSAALAGADGPTCNLFAGCLQAAQPPSSQVFAPRATGAGSNVEVAQSAGFRGVIRAPHWLERAAPKQRYSGRCNSPRRAQGGGPARVTSECVPDASEVAESFKTDLLLKKLVSFACCWGGGTAVADGTMLLKKIYIFSPVQDAILSSLGSCSSWGLGQPCALRNCRRAIRQRKYKPANIFCYVILLCNKYASMRAWQRGCRLLVPAQNFKCPASLLRSYLHIYGQLCCRS